MRPESIVLFEKVFFVSLAVGLVNAALSWTRVEAMLDDPALASAGIGGGAVAVSLVLGLMLPLLLWYFIARRASNVAKWIFVLLTALQLLAFLATLADPLAPRGALMVGAAIANLLQVFAAWLLFKPDARDWLEGSADGPPPGPTGLR